MKALVTGMRRRARPRDRDPAPSRGLRGAGARPTNGFDVTDPARGSPSSSVDLAVLNAGVLTGEGDFVALSHKDYRRAVAVNVDGVVLGVPRLAQA